MYTRTPNGSILPMPEDRHISTPTQTPPSLAATRTQSRPVTRPSGRDESLDIAKGIGILLVVLGHCFDGLIASEFFPPSLAWPTLAVFAIYLFHMPLFFVVSGHLASGKHRPAGATIAKLLPTIVYPYFLWSILQGLTQVYLSKFTTSHVSISVLYKILWIPIVPYWFLYALFFCHLGYLVIRRFSHRVQLVIAAAVFLAPEFFQPLIWKYQLNIFPETVRGFLYFVLGVTTVALVKQFGRWTAVASTILFALFATIFYQSHWGLGIVDVAVLPAAFAGIVATLAWSRLLASRGGWLVRQLAFWGRYSMSIYVMHIFFTAGVRIALKRVFARYLVPGLIPGAFPTIVEIVAATALGVALPLAINWVVSKCDLDKWFGLQHMETA